MEKLSRVFFGLCLLFILAWAALQFSYKQVDDYSIYEASSGPWAVNGIRLGTSLDECRRKLGQPVRSETNNYNGKIVKEWRTATSEVSITFESPNNGKACEIMGKTLTDHNGKVVVWESAGEDEVKAILKGATVKNSYSPGGSGIISCSSVHTATTFTCKDADGYYSVNFYKGSLSNIFASKEKKR